MWNFKLLIVFLYYLIVLYSCRRDLCPSYSSLLSLSFFKLCRTLNTVTGDHMQFRKILNIVVWTVCVDQDLKTTKTLSTELTVALWRNLIKHVFPDDDDSHGSRQVCVFVWKQFVSVSCLGWFISLFKLIAACGLLIRIIANIILMMMTFWGRKIKNRSARFC